MYMIEFKNGKSFNIKQMRDYFLTENDGMLDDICKQFNFHGKARLMKKIEDVFGSNGIIVLFAYYFDFSGKIFDINDYLHGDGVNEDIKRYKPKKSEILKWEFKNMIRNINYFFKDSFRIIFYPIRELIHVKKYNCSIHTSYFFDYEFLPLIYKNLEYYEKTIRDRYCIEGWIKKNLEDVNNVKDFCLAYQTLYSLTEEIRSNFDILNYGEYVTDYSKQVIFKSCDELDKEIEEKSKEMVKVIMESQI